MVLYDTRLSFGAKTSTKVRPHLGDLRRILCRDFVRLFRSLVPVDSD